MSVSPKDLLKKGVLVRETRVDDSVGSNEVEADSSALETDEQDPRVLLDVESLDRLLSLDSVHSTIEHAEKVQMADQRGF